jgi:L-alanine-DL-glutamate epimerase-like enolase superfamily enzyme
VRVETLHVSAYKIPTASPESDGTYEWDATTLVVVEAGAGGKQGLGYTYADVAAAQLIDSTLKAVVCGKEALAVAESWAAMVRAIRNLGRPGISSMAIAAVDVALWDLKARLLGVSLADLIGRARSTVPAYGSGGFTSYTLPELQEQLGRWAEDGLTAVKMKIGRDWNFDSQRVRAARAAIGANVDLYIDANGAYNSKRALQRAAEFASSDVVWFEEPVSSDDLEGLRRMREHGPPGMEISAGEYGYDALYFRRMLEAESVDVLQADATRCAGVTGFLQADALCGSYGMALSAHTAPSLHAHLCCAAIAARNVEYFYDHARVEQMCFDGALQPQKGLLCPDLSRPGLGLELKRPDIERYRVYGIDS